MWWQCFLDLLRTYQTVAAGFLALCGVVIALMGNSRIARRERRAKILHDKQSLRVTLLEELRSLKRSMEFRDKDLESTTDPVYALADDPMAHLFRASLDKLGLMPAEVLSKVLPSYLSAEHLPKNLRISQHPDTPADIAAHFIVVPQKSYERARLLHRRLGEQVGEAITALEQWTPTASD